MTHPERLSSSETDLDNVGSILSVSHVITRVGTQRPVLWLDLSVFIRYSTHPYKFTPLSINIQANFFNIVLQYLKCVCRDVHIFIEYKNLEIFLGSRWNLKKIYLLVICDENRGIEDNKKVQRLLSKLKGLMRALDECVVAHFKFLYKVLRKVDLCQLEFDTTKQSKKLIYKMKLFRNKYKYREIFFHFQFLFIL